MSATRTVRLLALVAALATPVVFAADKADAGKGKELFEQRCNICHSASKEPGGPPIGPNLFGVVGRKAGSLSEFLSYTTGLKAYDVKWSDKTLDVFLKDPFSTVPGTMMAMPVPDDKERADVIAYLSTLK